MDLSTNPQYQAQDSKIQMTISPIKITALKAWDEPEKLCPFCSNTCLFWNWGFPNTPECLYWWGQSAHCSTFRTTLAEDKWHISSIPCSSVHTAPILHWELGTQPQQDMRTLWANVCGPSRRPLSVESFWSHNWLFLHRERRKHNKWKWTHTLTRTDHRLKYKG